MKLRNGEILEAQPSFVKMSDIKLPVVTSFKFAELSNALDEKLKAFNKVREGLVKTYEIYGEEDKKTGGEIVKTKGDKGNVAKFVAEFEELLNQEVEVDITKVKLPEKIAGTCDKCNHNMDVPFLIEPSVLTRLVKFIEVE